MPIQVVYFQQLNRLFQIQLDNLDVFRPVEYPVGKQLLGDYPDSTEGHTDDDCEQQQQANQRKNADDQVPDVVSGIELGRLAPGYVRIVVH